MIVYLVETGILDETLKWALSNRVQFLCSYWDYGLLNKTITLLEAFDADRTGETTQPT